MCDIVPILTSVSAIAAIIAPVITTCITKFSETKQMQMKMFFEAKETAYIQFSEAVGNCRIFPSSEAVDRLNSAYIHAVMFSNEKTSEKMTALVGALTSKERDNPLLAKLQMETISAMREEMLHTGKKRKI